MDAVSDAGDPETWRERRADVLRAQEAALEAARRDEHERATALLREGIAGFRAAGIAPIPLRALADHGRGSVRTSLTGWYLTASRTLGVDTEARFYVLRAPGGLLSRLRGVELEPRDAPLVVGRGARDGETVTLEELLRMRREDPVRP